jgi:O-antigen/teichoic acid export membrane protein
MLNRLRLALGADGRRAVGNALFKSISVPIEKACRIAVVVVAAPALGEAAFGVYQFATTLAALFAIGTDLGLSMWTTRALARDRSRAAAIVGTGLRVRAFSGGILLLAIGVATAVSGSSQLRRALILFGAAGLASTFIDYFGAIFRGFERLHDEAHLAIARAIFTTGAALLALRLERSLTGFGVGTLVGTLGGCLWGVGILRRRYDFPRVVGAPAFDRPLARRAISEAAPIWLATLLSLVYFKIDVVILRGFVGDAELGAYSAVFKVFEALTIVPTIVMAAAFSPMARAHGEPERQRRWERWLVALLLLLGGAIGSAIFFTSQRIVGLLFGSSFLQGSASLRLLALGLPVMFLNAGLWQFLIARNLEVRNLLLAGILLVINVGVNLVLIPRLRGPGAALATVITEVAHAVLAIAAIRWAAPAHRAQGGPSPGSAVGYERGAPLDQ